jgi:hypothetical protein
VLDGEAGDRVTLMTLVTLLFESHSQDGRRGGDGCEGGVGVNGGFQRVARVSVGEAGNRVTLVTLVTLVLGVSLRVDGPCA